MKRSSLDELIDAERRNAPHPSRSEARTTWQRIERDLGIGAMVPVDVSPESVTPVAKGGVVVGTTAKVVVAAVLAGGAGVAVVATSGDDGRDRVTPTVAAEAPTRDRLERPMPAEAPPNEPSIPQPPPIETPKPAAPELEAAVAEPPAPAPRRRPAVRARREDQRKTSPMRPGGIGRELELVKRAGAAVNAGEHVEALEILATHAREFPDGTLNEDRSALRVLALCGAGRDEQGRSARASFLGRWPGSVHAERVRNACASPEPG